MSHFIVLIIGDNPEEQLEPYDENRQVVPHEVECSCVGQVAAMAGTKEAKKELGDIDGYRERFKKQKDQSQKAWEKFIKPLQDAREKHEKAHPEYGKPEKDCKECNGTGKRMSQYNPDSKWDWHTLGGRWLGYFKAKKGKVGRLGEAGVFENKPLYDYDAMAKGDIDFEYMKTANRLRAEKYWDETQEKIKNGKKVHFSGVNGYKTKEDYVKACIGITPYSVVKDGIWHSKGDMGWWGMSNDKKTEEEWDKEFEDMLNSLPDDTLLSIYDCHI